MLQFGEGTDGLDAPHRVREHRRRLALDAVALGMRGVVVDLDDEAVGSDGCRRDGDGLHEMGVSGGMGRVDDDGQMCQAVEDRDHSEVKGVPHRGLEGADAPLAEDDIRVSGGHDVFGAHQEFLEGGGHAALQQTAQRIMRYSCACMAPMWLTTSVGVLN